jgi:hypothetical protein
LLFLYTIWKYIGCNIFIIAPTPFCKYSLRSSQNPQYNSYRVSVCTHTRRHTQVVETDYCNKKPGQDLALKRQKEVKSKDHSINSPYVYQNSQMACVCMWYHAVYWTRQSVKFQYKCVLQPEEIRYQLSFKCELFFATMILNTEKVELLLVIAIGPVRSST